MQFNFLDLTIIKKVKGIQVSFIFSQMIIVSSLQIKCYIKISMFLLTSHDGKIIIC